MMYAHDRMTADELEQVKRHRLAHYQGELNMAQKLAETFIPPISAGYPETHHAAELHHYNGVALEASMVDVWTVNGRTI